jgi:hypothetical protein
MRSKLAALLIAALAITGCSAGAESAPEAVSATTASAETVEMAATPEPTATPTPTKTADPAQAWADDMINLLLNGNSKSSFDDFNDEIAHHYIKSWSQESKGALSIVVSGSKWTKCDLDEVGFTVMMTAGWETPELTRVIVSDEDRKLVRSLTSEDYKNRKYAVPETCA